MLVATCGYLRQNIIEDVSEVGCREGSEAGRVFGEKGFTETDLSASRNIVCYCNERRVGYSGEFVPRARRTSRRYLEDLVNSLHRLPWAR